MKIVIADQKQGRCYQVELDETKSKPLYGLKIGEQVDGTLLGASGFKLQITGGTDKDGFPMRPDVHGLERKRILLSVGPGFRQTEKGERRKKTVRGNTLAEDIAQVNVKVLEYGKRSIAETLGLKVEEKPKEEKAEKKEEAKPAEVKPEKKEAKPAEIKSEKKETKPAEAKAEKPAEEKKEKAPKKEKAKEAEKVSG